MEPSPSHLANERFVAFAFAGADLLAEVDQNGTVTYAAGAYRSLFGLPAERFIGRAFRSLVHPSDDETFELAFMLLVQRSRLPPTLLKLNDRNRSAFTLSGLALDTPGQPRRLCLSLARPPERDSGKPAGGTPHSLARTVEGRIRTGRPCDIGLLDTTVNGTPASAEAIGHALVQIGSDAVATEIAPGRFGLVGTDALAETLAAVERLIDTAAGPRRGRAPSGARHISTRDVSLSPLQMARALRQALASFARAGVKGLADAGFADGLEGYIRTAESRLGSLHHAIQNTQFTMAFQPVVSLSDDSVHHYEALIRPKRSVDHLASSPQEFISLCESLGLAEELDLIVCQTACDAAHATGHSVAFNMSGQSVQSPVFRAKIVEVLSKHRVTPLGRMVVELTETAEIENIEEATLTANALRELGLPFCLDDFGAGSADTRVLHALRPDIVKLDGSYLIGITEQGRARSFLRGLVDMAHAAGAAIVAERIEQEAEVEILRQFGVEYGQGWLFGKPGALPSVGVAGERAAVGQGGPSFVDGAWR